LLALFGARTAAFFGIDAHPIGVEVGMYPSGAARDFAVAGVPGTAVTINLTPANVRKEGAGFDLPMAVCARRRPQRPDVVDGNRPSETRFLLSHGRREEPWKAVRLPGVTRGFA
jgi:hypothetical protein